jgi:autotransporter-associated beta strand protein
MLTYAGTNPHLGWLDTAETGNPGVVFAREAAAANGVNVRGGSLTVNATTHVAWLRTGADTTVQLAEGKTLTLGYNTYSEGSANHDLDGVVAGAGRLRIEENAAVLTGANSFSGGLELSYGTVAFTSAAALGTGTITVVAGGYDSALTVLAPDMTVTNPIVLEAPSGGGEGDRQTTLALSGADRFYYEDYAAPGNRDLTLTGTISGTGNLRKRSDNTVTLTGANTFAGDITIEEGIMIFSTAATTGAPTNRLNLSSYYSAQGATARFLAGNPQIGGLNGYSYDSTAVVELGAGVNLTIGVHDHGETGDQYFYGTISGDGSIIKDGPASQTLIGANTYTGGTTVRQGTLIAGHDQAFGAGAITINGGRLGTEYGITFTNPIIFGANGGVLAGNGTFTQALTIGAGVGLAPGSSPGTMTFSDLTLAGGGFLEFEIMDPTLEAGSGHDTLHVTGPLTITATPGNLYRINLISLDANGQPGALEFGTFGTTYTLVLATSGGLSGFDAASFQLDASAFTSSYASQAQFYLTSSGNDLMLNFTPVPEPSTYALLALGAGMLWFVRRRR